MVWARQMLPIPCNMLIRPSDHSRWGTPWQIYGTTVDLRSSEPIPENLLHLVEGQVPQCCVFQRFRILQHCIVSPPLVSCIYILKFLFSNSGWDIHDLNYSPELLISNKRNGYRDVIAEIDLSTYRRIPWEDNVPFFLVSFLDPDTRKPLPVCSRGVVSLVAKKCEALGWTPMAGCEYEVNI